MSGIQQFFLWIMPRSIGQAMEKESRLWMIRCPRCSSESSYWDLGGIRYLAAGRPRKLRQCVKCQEVSWHETYKKA